MIRARATPSTRPRRAGVVGTSATGRAALAVVLIAVGASGCARAGPSARVPPPDRTAQEVPTAAGLGTASTPALRVLHGWDERRLEAWRRADAGALGRLYVPGSRTGRADVRLLREYAAHGLVVQRLSTQVFAVQVLARGRGRLVLRVTDRVVAGSATRGGRAVALPATAPAVRVVTLERGATPARWRVREATRLGG